MACFVVPAAEAVVTKIVEKAESKREQTPEYQAHLEETCGEVKIPFPRKLKWLNYLLIGGAVLLMFEHVWHGEVVAWFPFLTNAANATDAAMMFHEMATVGVAMAALVTGVWAVMCMVADSFVRKENRARKLAAEETL